ncbi:4547_t:CDS:2 [Ambispora gerdemannii]|uniref:D-arabinono-1,4-lactone oxidase n=1 Tax=Ambispora gerdemannii TaxID=144530 RepID=A0A9N9A564_9GLOM|nr:4547_t:CDS:2 [Ambispora gerdemannii]
MSNRKTPEAHYNWFCNSIERLVNGKDDKEKASILNEIHNELENLKNVLKIPKKPKAVGNFPTPLYPKTESEIEKIVQDAYNKGDTIIRVIGSGHSVKDAILDIPPGKKVKLLSLKEFHGVVKIDQENKTVTVKAGTHLNRDPRDKSSTVENSLNYIIDQAGYALPDLGGIAHQTVGGFLSTGSSGGSLTYGLEDSIIGIRIVNGKGKIEDLTSSDSKFFAAGVSMGLLGIITQVTFKLIPKYYIYGNQVCAVITPLNPDYQEGCPIDLIGDGTPTVPNLHKFFTQGTDYDAEYSRILWWPQEGVNRLVIWKAKRTSINDTQGYTKPTSPYKEFPEIGGSTTNTQIIASIVFIVLNIISYCDDEWYKKLAAYLLSFFNGVILQSFQDTWYNGLPMDDKVSDILIPTIFTELWFPIGLTQKLMKKLNELYEKGGNRVVGNNATELYTARKSLFWLSPSYEQDVVRIDPFYFEWNPIGTPEEFFNQYWTLFKDDEFRCHWGKYVPDDYWKNVPKLYTKYDEWMSVRAEMDPKQVNIHLC